MPSLLYYFGELRESVRGYLSNHVEPYACALKRERARTHKARVLIANTTASSILVGAALRVWLGAHSLPPSLLHREADALFRAITPPHAAKLDLSKSEQFVSY